MVYDVVIVIVSYKMRGLVRTCLRSLYRTLADSPLKVKIVVVDNASGDGVEETVAHEYPEVAVQVNAKNLGFAAAVNRGLEYAEARFYLVLNPDIYFPESGLIDAMVQWLEENPQAGMLGPRLKYPNETIQPSCYRYPSFWVPLYHRTFLRRLPQARQALAHYLMQDFNHEETRPVDGIFGAAMMVRAEAFKEVGGMDEKNFFMFFEDIDWCRRLTLRGWPVIYVPDITLVHYHGRPSAGGWFAILTNPVMRMHIKSWLKYFWKWRKTRL